MCGIVGYVGPQAALDVVVEGLRRLEYRGYDSAGVAIVADNAIHLAKKAGKISNLDKLFPVEGRRHADSVGGGARINFDRFSLDTALAVPLTHVGLENRKPDPRLLVSLTSRLWPWSFK